MVNELRFDGRVAVVTGAGGNPGLGRNYAMLLAERGAKVVVNDLGVGPDGRREGQSTAGLVAAEIRAAGGEAVADGNSVATPDGAAAVIKTAIDEWGRLDIVINNAGIAPFALFEEISDADIQAVVNVHLFGQIWMCRAAWPHMVAQKYGRIVNITSMTFLSGLLYQPIYSAAKLGSVGLTRALASEGMRHGITANSLGPAASTLAWQTMLGEEWNRKAAEAGLTPESVAPMTVYLAHESCTTTGKTISTAAGGATELLFAMTPGVKPGELNTLEAVRDQFDNIVDRSHCDLVPDPDGVIPEGMQPRPYQPR